MCMLMVRRLIMFQPSIWCDFKNLFFIFHFTDIENLLVNNEYPMITGVQNDNIVIPCKPTSKNVAVQLIKDGDEVNIYVRMLKYFFLCLFLREFFNSS